MEVRHEAFLPDASLNREEMEQLQRELAETAVFTDQFDFDPKLDGVTVAGIDQAFLDDWVVSGVVVMKLVNGQQTLDDSTDPGFTVVEKVHAVTETKIPYIPGLLAFREGEPILAALQELSVDPDLLVVDGSGRIHFREAGIATHIGVLCDVPSVGVAKNLLCGKLQGSVDSLEQGTRVAVTADDSVETAEPDELIGYAYQSKQYSGNRTVNPLYVSTGHRVSDGVAVDLVERLCSGYKLPEPTRRADKYVDEVKQSL